MGSITVRERIDPNLLASLFANYRSSADAVMELVDNSVDSRIDGVPLTVDIAVRPQSLFVVTTGGQGMGVREIERNYLRWGGSPKRGTNLIGRYGQGGKAAIGHLGQRFTIEASRPGEAVAFRFTDPDYRDRRSLKTYAVEECPKRVEAADGYVRIRIDGVDKRIDTRTLAQRLADTYRPLLERGQLRLVLDGAEVAVQPITAIERRLFSVNAGGARVRGWTGLVDPERPVSGWKPGLRCYRLGRLISEGELFGHPGPGTEPGVARLMGEVELPAVDLTTNKSDFNRDSAGWVAVETRMSRLLAPIVRRLQREPEAPPPVSAVRAAEQVRRLLGQALRLSERPDLFVGMSRERAARKGEDRLPLDAAEETPEPRPAASPKTPSPPADPAQGRRRGFGNVVVRALDPTVRSVNTVEDGVRTVVINSRHPLYIERRGDFVYQLETAAREVCRAAEATTDDYEKRVNDLVLAALRLRARRRRPAPGGRQLSLPDR